MSLRLFLITLLYVFFLYMPFLSCAATAQDIRAIGYNLSNLETEVEMIKQRLDNQQQSNEALTKETSQLLKATQETLSRTKEGTDTLKKSQDKNVDKLVSDIKMLKNHINDLSNSFADLTKRLQTCMENDQVRNQQIQDLERALRTLTEALIPKPVEGIYTVKNGDTLDKIAKATGVSSKTLKELNGMNSDKIRVGQQLKLK